MNRRKTTIRQLEDQLHQTLKELKSSRAECEQLLYEREDSEREMLNVLGKNQKMKSELVELHSEMLIIQSHRHELQTVLAGFDQSSDAFDVALKRIADLEWEPRDAHKHITILDSQKNNRNMSHTQSLFEELICNSPTMCSANSPSNSDSLSSTQKFIKKNHNFGKNLYLRKERSELLNKLNQCNSDLESCRCNYEYEIQQLHSELSNMNKTLQEITYKYDMAQNEI
ncbi:unnamed protein product, partial [Leptidea sinapis]